MKIFATMKIFASSSLLSILLSSVSGLCPDNSDLNYGEEECLADPGWCTVPEEFKDYPVIDLSSRNAPLRELATFFPESQGPYNLNLQPAYFCGPNWKGPIQSFGGKFHGETIRFNAGTTFNITYKNLMTNPLGNEVNNEYRLPNSTNLHLHGGHISPKSPGDNVKLLIQPEEEYKFEYEFPLNHEPGTHWYHPHLHGSVSFQTGSGTSGMFIVEDPVDYLPPQIANMPEIPIILQELDIISIVKIAQKSKARLKDPFKEPLPQNPPNDDETIPAPGNGYYWYNTADIDTIIRKGNQTATTELENLLLFNGQYVPKITVKKGKWYRFRMVMSSTQDAVIFGAPAGCDLQLLSHDGIYLTDAPRKVEAFVLAPGNRADVAMRCDLDPGIYKMETLAKGRNYGSTKADTSSEQAIKDNVQFFVPVAECDLCKTQPYVAVLNVIASDGPREVDLRPFGESLRRPCYIADLSSSGQPPSFYLDYGRNSQIQAITGEQGPVCNNNANFGLCVNGIGFEEELITNTYFMGEPQETYLVNNGGHPHHQHVNPFQLKLNTVIVKPLELPDGRKVDINNWDTEGDWYDTLQHPGSSSNVNAEIVPSRIKGAASLVRWVASDYNTINEEKLAEGVIVPESSQIFHCHILTHEDSGMAGQDIIVGNAGTIWKGAKEIDPTCATMNQPLVGTSSPTDDPTNEPTNEPTRAPTKSMKKSKSKKKKGVKRGKM